jgi:hypothetical protein
MTPDCPALGGPENSYVTARDGKVMKRTLEMTIIATVR